MFYRLLIPNFFHKGKRLSWLTLRINNFSYIKLFLKSCHIIITSRSVRRFITFLQVDVKSLSHWLQVKSHSMRFNHTFLRFLNGLSWVRLLILMQMLWCDNSVAEIIVVYGNVVVSIWMTWVWVMMVRNMWRKRWTWTSFNHPWHE